VTRRPFHYRWQLRLGASPERLWPLVADTNRFNRDMGLPVVQALGGGRNARRRLAFSKAGVRVEWEEEPFEWLEPRRFSVVRRYLQGPVAEMRVAVELRPAGAGTLLVYDVRAWPRSGLGLVAIPLQIGWLRRRRFAATIRRYDRDAQRAVPELPLHEPAVLVGGGHGRLAAARAALAQQGVAPELVDRLVELVERGDEPVVGRLRPYVLAAAWQADRRQTLELCLLATRAGLLELRWDLLCPLCHGAKETATSLRELDPGVHCDSCRIDFTVDFEHSVELTFRPSPAVRRVAARDYCVGGPRVTPHVVAQQLLAAGDRRLLRPRLAPGRYRLRTHERARHQRLVVRGGGASEATLAAGSLGGELALAPAPLLRLENATDREQLLILERTGHPKPGIRGQHLAHPLQVGRAPGRSRARGAARPRAARPARGRRGRPAARGAPPPCARTAPGGRGRAGCRPPPPAAGS
jgi:adenylate cyclase